ncbi:MAG: hypothetical protein SGI88_00685 [Candidatus Hydrogenedentes bacterium]|nr:hypothetical protein [Candidatus Hydrogenedentota bacterium]
MDIWTWSPFWSEEARKAIVHFTEPERRRFLFVQFVIGICVSLFGMLLANTLFGETVTIASASVAGLATVGFVFFSYFSRRTVRRILSNTEWALQQGYNAENLRLTRFGRRKLDTHE